MEQYRSARIAHLVEGQSKRSLARELGCSRATIDKMVRTVEPRGYHRRKPSREPKLLDCHKNQIDEWLEQDKQAPRKQRHTVKRILERLQQEHAYEGQYTIVKDYVRKHKQWSREKFMPLDHPAGHAQADFGEVWCFDRSVKQKFHYFVMNLPQSGALYTRLYRSATTEAWIDGHVHAFKYFGGLPLSVLYDNDSCLVSKPNRDGIRKRTQLFDEFVCYYLFEDRYARPGKGNDKGHVEGSVGYSRRNFMVPVPEFESLEEFNARVEQLCRKDLERIAQGKKQTKAELLKADLKAMNALPERPFEACHRQTGLVNSQSLVRYKCNDYSVPTALGHRQVTIRGFVDKVEISCDGQVLGEHERCYDKRQKIYDPAHYVALARRKPGSLDQAAPLASVLKRKELKELKRLLEAGDARKGKWKFIQVLCLLESCKITELCSAIKASLQRGAITVEAIESLLRRQQQRAVPPLNMSHYPDVPQTSIATTQASSYMSLLSGVRGPGEDS